MDSIDPHVLLREKGLKLTAKRGDHFFALAFPGPYSLGMANLGFQTILSVLFQIPGWRPERFFVDSGQRSLESQAELFCFPVIGFSLCYERDLPVMLRMLEAGQVRSRAIYRTLSDPLVVVGGAVATMNPELVAPFADVVIIGEGEGTLPLVLTTWQTWRDRIHHKRDLLLAMSGIEGVYLPGLVTPLYQENELRGFDSLVPGYLPVKRKWIDLDTHECRTFIYAPDNHFRNTALVEINRGCSYQCRFCAGTVIYRPLRNRSIELVHSMLDTVSSFSHKIGLVGADVLAHPQLDDILKRARTLQLGTTFSSLSAQSLWARREHLDCLFEGGVRTITLAPESGNETTRNVLGKSLENHQWKELISHLQSTRNMNVKLYFMLGKPWSGPEDDLDFLAEMSPVNRSTGKLSVSYSFFVPKPLTPLEDTIAVSYDDWKTEKRVFEKGLKKLGLTFSGESPRQAWIEMILARSDRLISEAMPRFMLGGGDSSLRVWSNLLNEAGRNLWEWPRSPWIGTVRPWHVVDSGTSETFRIIESQRAQTAQAAGRCFGKNCTRCGVCTQ